MGGRPGKLTGPARIGSKQLQAWLQKLQTDRSWTVPGKLLKTALPKDVYRDYRTTYSSLKEAYGPQSLGDAAAKYWQAAYRAFQMKRLSRRGGDGFERRSGKLAEHATELFEALDHAERAAFRETTIEDRTWPEPEWPLQIPIWVGIDWRLAARRDAQFQAIRNSLDASEPHK